MSAMVDLSRAIRETCDKHGGFDLWTMPDQLLSEATTILGAFYLDFKGEMERRTAAVQPPPEGPQP